jgi:ribosomal RNA assembly protein
MKFVDAPSDRLLDRISDERDVRFEKIGDMVKIISKDSILEMDVKEAIDAFNNGFKIHECMKLLNKENYTLRIIDISNITRNTQRAKQQKSRVIGENGRTREIIEELTTTDVSVKGFNVGIIGETENAYFASKMVQELVMGSPHASVYSKMESYSSNKNKIEYIREDD